MEKSPDGYGRHHADEVIDLTGRAWLMCSFDRCELRLDRYEEPIVGAIMNDCKLVGDAWPQWNNLLKFDGSSWKYGEQQSA